MFFYKIHFFEEEKIKVGCGLVCAASYGAAADRIVEFYGEENFSSFEQLYRCEDVLMSEELADMFELKE